MLGPLELIIVIVLPVIIIGTIASRSEKEYKIFKHHTGGYKAVKVGLAWVAGTFFMPIWFLFRGLWSYFVLYLTILIVVIAIDFELYGELGSFNYNTASDREWVWLIIQIIVFILPLFKGNDWTAKNLVKKGYLFQDSVHAVSKKNAIAIVLDNNTKSNYIENNTEIFDEENDSQLESSYKSSMTSSPADSIWSKHYLYAWVQLFTGALFIILLLDSGDLITTIELSLKYLVGLSALVWIYKKASGLSQSSIELWYVLFTAISWILLAIHIYLR
jgi:hypothetical protein